MKIMGNKIPAAFFLFMLCLSLRAQSAPGAASFVSGLRAEVRGNLIRLSWIDSPAARGPVHIYRSRVPFNETTDLAALGRPVEISHGVEVYIDEIEEPGVYYYFAASGDESGQRFLLLAASGNSIAVNVEPSPDLPVRTAASAPRPVSAGPSGIRAEITGEAVTVSFTRSRTDGKAILYRSLNPIKSADDLLGAVIVQPNAASPFMDYPVPGVPYYYAVINEEDLIGGNAVIIPGVNATDTAVQAPLRDGLDPSPSSSAVRVIPLPQVTLAGTGLGAENGGSASPEELGPDALRALENIPQTRRTPAGAEKEASILREDTAVSGEGELYLLGSIVRGSFSNRNWGLCREELNRFLSLPRSDAAAARAHFYLGQAYYFSGMYREALLEFLRAQAVYPVETLEWIQACLPLLREEAGS